MMRKMMSILTMITINKTVTHMIQKEQILEIWLTNNRIKNWDITAPIKIKTEMLSFCQNMLKKLLKIIMLAIARNFRQTIDN
jgi:hypothetical protein